MLNTFILSQDEKSIISQHIQSFENSLPKAFPLPEKTKSVLDRYNEYNPNNPPITSVNSLLLKILEDFNKNVDHPILVLQRSNLKASLGLCYAVNGVLDNLNLQSHPIRGVVELIKIYFLFKDNALEPGPQKDSKRMEILLTTFALITALLINDDMVMVDFENLSKILGKLMDSIETIWSEHEKLYLKMSEIEELIRRNHSQSSSSGANIELIRVEKNYKQTTIDPKVMERLIHDIEAIQKEQKPRTQFIIFPSHHFFHSLSLDVQWNSKKQYLEFTAIDPLEFPIIKPFILGLVKKFQNAQFNVCICDEYQKSDFDCRLYSYLICEEIYPYFNHQQLSDYPRIKQPRFTKRGDLALNEKFHAQLDRYPNVKWLPPQAFGSKLIVMAQSLTLMKQEWEKLPKKDMDLDEFIKTHRLNSKQQHYYIDVRRTELRNALKKPYQQQDDVLKKFKELTISSSQESSFSSDSIATSSSFLAQSSDLSLQFRTLAAKGELDEMKKIVRPELLNSKGEASQQTALHRAAGQGHIDVVKWLIEQGADLTVRDSHNRTPRNLAEKYNKEPVVTLLKTEEGKQFRLAADRNDGIKLEKLFSEDILNSQGEESKQTALHRAAGRGHYEATQWLLAKGADIFIYDKKHKNPVDLAIENTKMTVLPLLQEKLTQVIEIQRYNRRNYAL